MLHAVRIWNRFCYFKQKKKPLFSSRPYNQLHEAESFLRSSTLYSTSRYITLFTTALSTAKRLQSTISYHLFLRFILILSFQLCKFLHSSLLLSDFPTKILYEYLLSPIVPRAWPFYYLLCCYPKKSRVSSKNLEVLPNAVFPVLLLLPYSYTRVFLGL